MTSVNDHVVGILKENPGITKEALASLVSEQVGKPVSEQSLRLGQLALQGLVRSVDKEISKTVTIKMPVFYATTQEAEPEPAN